MIYSLPLTFLFFALIALNLWAWYKLQNSDAHKQYLRPLMLVIVWHYLYLFLADLTFPETGESNGFINDKIQLFAWIIIFLSTAGFVVVITKSENGVSRIENGFFGNSLIPIYLIANLIILYLSVMEKAIFQALPKDLSTFIFVGMYYLFTALGFIGSSKYFAKRKVHASLQTSARAVLVFLASSIGGFYWSIKFILVTASLFLVHFFNLSILSKIDQFTKWGFAAILILLMFLFLPDHFFNSISQWPLINFFWGRNVLAALTDVLEKTGCSSQLVFKHDLDLAIVEAVTRIMDMRGLTIEGQTDEKSQFLLEVKDSTDIREVIESCLALSRKLKDARMT